MRHTPCGCRSAHLVEVRSNSRLPPVSTMRRAKQCRYFARSPPPSKRHSRLTIVRRGCNRERLAEDSWRSHVHRTYIAQRVQLFKLQTRNVGGRGGLPSFFSGGYKGGILFEKRIPPLPPRPHRGWGHPVFFLGKENGGCEMAAASGAAFPLRAKRGKFPFPFKGEERSTSCTNTFM